MVDLFSEISEHQIKGIMMHAQLADYFGFLGLKGLAEWQEHQFIEESESFRELHKYVMKNCNKLLPEKHVENPMMIPQTWLNYSRMQVDSSTRKNAIKDALEKWMKWEQDTKAFYESKYKTLVANNYIGHSDMVLELIDDVSEELCKISYKVIEYKAVDYDLAYIMAEQEEMYHRYKHH